MIPKKTVLPRLTIQPIRQTAEDVKTAAICNEFVRQSGRILFDHAINQKRLSGGIKHGKYCPDAGSGEMGHFEPFTKKYGITGSVISAASLVNGIGSAVGLSRVPVRGSPAHRTAISPIRLRQRSTN